MIIVDLFDLIGLSVLGVALLVSIVIYLILIIGNVVKRRFKK